MQEFQEGRYLAWSQDLCLLHHTGGLHPEQGVTFNRSNRELWGSFPRVRVGKNSWDFLKIKVRILTNGNRSQSVTQLEAAFSSLVLLKQSYTTHMKRSNQDQNLLLVKLLSPSSTSISGPSLVTSNQRQQSPNIKSERSLKHFPEFSTY